MAFHPCRTRCGRFARHSAYTVEQCRPCWLVYHDDQYRSASDPVLPSEWRADRCRFLRERTEFKTNCRTGLRCLHSCVKSLPAVPAEFCQTCSSYAPCRRNDSVYPVPWVGDYDPPEVQPMKWQYGVTTIPSRRRTTLPGTLQSLKSAGFDQPHLFVDGCDDGPSWRREFDLERVTCRYPAALTAGNWVLSLYELWARDSTANRYAIFQDDFVTYKGLREYLDWSPYPENGYLNLYTFPMNQRLAPKTPSGGTVDGWFRSNQLGKGAVALVFDAKAVRALLGQPYIVDRFLTVDENPVKGGRRCDRSIDGGIVDALKAKGVAEYCHSPSLVQHVGHESSMNNHGQKQAESFRGEGWDVRELIKS